MCLHLIWLNRPFKPYTFTLKILAFEILRNQMAALNNSENYTIRIFFNLEIHEYSVHKITDPKLKYNTKLRRKVRMWVLVCLLKAPIKLPLYEVNRSKRRRKNHEGKCHTPSRKIYSS